ncbi:hypothetical protein ABEB36_003557, partial [Hypothenemus hampei]
FLDFSDITKTDGYNLQEHMLTEINVNEEKLFLQRKQELWKPNGCNRVYKKMNANWYIHIIEDHILPYADFTGYDNFVLMHDNANVHATKTVAQHFEDVGLNANSK